MVHLFSNNPNLDWFRRSRSDADTDTYSDTYSDANTNTNANAGANTDANTDRVAHNYLRW